MNDDSKAPLTIELTGLSAVDRADLMSALAEKNVSLQTKAKAQSANASFGEPVSTGIVIHASMTVVAVLAAFLLRGRSKETISREYSEIKPDGTEIKKVISIDRETLERGDSDLITKLSEQFRL